MSRLVIAMSTRKVHRADCRYVVSPGSATSPYADENALRLLKLLAACSWLAGETPYPQGVPFVLKTAERFERWIRDGEDEE